MRSAHVAENMWWLHNTFFFSFSRSSGPHTYVIYLTNNYLVHVTDLTVSNCFIFDNVTPHTTTKKMFCACGILFSKC